jgi:Phospholipase A2-like domain
MTKRSRTKVARSQKSKRGAGLLNTLINKLPFEAHLPGYSYLGPGTRLQKRLQRGDQGINPLDEAAKEHDIAYSQSDLLTDRHKADQILENKAWDRVKSKDASLGEKAAAWLVTNTMKAKRKLGMGLVKKAIKPKTGGKMNKSGKVNKSGALRKVKIPKTRIIPIPKRGGFLPLLFPALAALGALGGGAAGIATAVNKAKADKALLDEQKRHNLALEAATKGKGLYLKPYKGYGLYLAPQKNFR